MTAKHDENKNCVKFQKRFVFYIYFQRNKTEKVMNRRNIFKNLQKSFD